MSQASSKKLKLMVVDDEPDNLDLLYRTFRRDFRVFKAESAVSALEVLDKEGEMAVIISDQRMPVMNGTEFLGKTVERFPETIRILLTGYTDVEDLVDAINSGKVFKYITKPWNPENLKAVVQQASETYKVLKQRTNELRRALRREEALNLVMAAIREEALDYEKMLQTIVRTIGQNFGASRSILHPIESAPAMPESFSYKAEDVIEEIGDSFPDATVAIEKVLETHQTQTTEGDIKERSWMELAIPLTVQQQPLAVLYLARLTRSGNWTDSDIKLLESVAEQAALALSQAKLYQRTQQQAQKMRAELEVARQIQHNLLRQSWGEVEGAKVQASCYPAREVGGDFFEVYVHPQGDVWLAVGDVSGKGVPAALFMASAISILRRELSQEISPEPDVVMRNLNQTMNEDLFGTNCFITMVIARYTPTTYKLVYANAGHIYPMVWNHQASPEEEPDYLKVRGVPVGILPVWKAKAGEMVLEQGDILLVTSDGITEATVVKDINSGGPPSPDSSSFLNQEGLWHLILQDTQSFDLTALLERFREYTNQIQEDDQTMLSLEVL
ncbi:SpoIIE family protein phosphatase [Lusitaniella coriacea LEGE 07157]|uniref:SpoIIE family protein phosphatase n=1 Tax=Lusitaniella coriacea LEGE 07157 TaxID=945747 RepID=A0A8J7DNE1_9CYAN|nr:SpoIIE family protein phosphatase [Lusitaniella coriacea]MBE9114444.1 SpoIIE family protein phosphatase [Lusitaniella coriacea LEGE 07157]